MTHFFISLAFALAYFLGWGWAIVEAYSMGFWYGIFASLFFVFVTTLVEQGEIF